MRSTDVERDDVGALLGQPDCVTTALAAAAPVMNATLPSTLPAMNPHLLLL